MKTPIPIDEPQRGHTVQTYVPVLDQGDPALDGLARFAARLLDTPIALVTLVDSDMVRVAGQVGLPGVREIARCDGFCGYAILQDEVLVVPDLTADSRFSDNPLVMGEPCYRFYAGAPVAATDGQLIGTVCVLDHTPREPSAEAVDRLVELAQQAGHIFERLRQLNNANADLRSALQKAESASNAKTAFLMTMSHELRTPLNAVIGFAQLLGRQIHGELGDPRYVAYARDIEESGSHLLRLINDILDVTKLDAGQDELAVEAVDLAAEVDWSLRLLNPKMTQYCARVTTDLPTPGPDVLFERRALRQVLLNLLGNALKYGGRKIDVSGRRDGARVRLTIADDGPGMNDSLRQTAFDAFVRGDTGACRTNEGTGLGLTLSKSLIELAGGRIALDSAPDQGTRVTITLNCADHSAAMGADSRPIEQRHATPHCKVPRCAPCNAARR